MTESDARARKIAALLAAGLDAGELSRQLARRMEVLAPHLLPAGYRDGRTWRCGSIAGEPGSSLAITTSGSRRGLWVDHADTAQAGDALALVAAVRCGGDLSDAICWTADWLGLTGETPAPSRAPDPPPDDAATDAEAARKRARAQQLWLAAQPKLFGTPAAAYLDGRGSLLSGLPRQPAALRYAPELWNTETGRHWPALVAAINGPLGAGYGHLATARIWLAQDAGGRWIKAPLRDPKKTLGSYKGGHVAIWRGSSAKPLRDAPAGDSCAIAEGIETALSIAQMAPELRVVAAVALSNMAAITLPPAIADVILCPDNDAGNEAARAANARAVDAAIRRFREEGRKVRLARPETPDADWNDILTGKAPA